MTKKAIIIGAGPAGLTAAFELLKRTDITPIILEKSDIIGGISRTTNFKGNRMDMGPHRFFSKSDRVMKWWLDRMPLETTDKGSTTISYQNKTREIDTNNNQKADGDKVMILIQRLTRIYFLRKFFSYPIQLSVKTLHALGIIKSIQIILSYCWIKLLPIKKEKNLEDFIINRFGRRLYLLFFKDYTEKVWGIPCDKISAEWGAQRIKGVSLHQALLHAMKQMKPKSKLKDEIAQKGTETSLIEQFLYPKYGPGSLWEYVARQIEEMGGKVYLNQDVKTISTGSNSVLSITSCDSITGKNREWEGEYFFSTMPVQELIAGMGKNVPEEVKKIAAGLMYRDFINVGILLKQLSTPNKDGAKYNTLEIKDNWIYIQEKDVLVGRIMIYNNWGTGMIKDPSTTWIGMEYFCNTTDSIWALDNEAIKELAIKELHKLGLCNPADVLDATVKRMEKTYPAYFGTYPQFEKIRTFTDQYENLFLVGRNGMHKYNNTDHSMLTAMVAVDNIEAGEKGKENLWSINTEQEYHEVKKIDKKEPTSPKLSGETKVAEKLSFTNYLTQDSWNKTAILLSIIVIILQFIFYKIRYPFANYMPDSYSYISAAASNADVNRWPIAYSKFLRLMSVFTHSDKVLTGVQYIFMQITGIIFLFTLFYFFILNKNVKISLLALFVLNPVAFYIANYISADAIFIGFSFLWISTTIWIILQPHPFQIFLQAMFILACFTIRYNAIYYPLITIFAFILSRQNWKYKIIGIVLTAALIMHSISFTSQKMKEATGEKQFSAFSGWQLANNALYMYQHIPSTERIAVPARLIPLEQMVKRHMDTLQKIKEAPGDSVFTYFYLWNAQSPLVQYMNKVWASDTTTPTFKKWASVSPLYADYGKFLIQHYPLQYAKYFMFPNLVKYASPPTEFLDEYNMGEDTVKILAKEWFNYKNQTVAKQQNKDQEISATHWFPIFSALVNTLFLLSMIGLIVFNVYHKSGNMFKNLIWIINIFWTSNLLFSIFASPVVLRYQMFPILVTLSVSMIIIQELYPAIIISEKKQSKTLHTVKL